MGAAGQMKIPMLKARATRDTGFLIMSLGTNLGDSIAPPFRILRIGLFYAPCLSGEEAVDDSRESPPIQ